jgi:MFS family permease
MSFAIRGNLIAPLGVKFNLTKEQLGLITGTAFWGFALSTIVGGWLCDVIGMRTILLLAFVGHALGIVTTIFANGFAMLFLGTLAFGLANGFVEAACNPLIATLYPDQKIKRLSMFHMWFPGGIVIGGLTAYFISKNNIGGDANWQVQMLTMVVPLAIYGALFIGKKFPATERSASGVSMNEMFAACLTPLYIVLLVCMTMSAATELVTGQWMPDILTFTTGYAGILFLVLVNGLMAIGRAFAGEIVHRISPIGMLIASSAFSAVGMFLLTRADSGTTATIAAVIFAVGVCFFWPTMLGVVSERFPRTGALGMSIMGGIGMLSTAIWLPIVGHYYDTGIANALPPGQTADALKAAAAGSEGAKAWAAAQSAGGRAGLGILVYLPVILFCIFIALYLYDRSRGGYKKEVLVQQQDEEAALEAPTSAAS